MMEWQDRPRRLTGEPLWRHLWRSLRWGMNLRLVPRWQEQQPDPLSRLVRPWLIEGLSGQGRLLLLLLPALLLLNIRREAAFPLAIPAFLTALLLTSALAGWFYRPRLRLRRHPGGHGVEGEPWRCGIELTNVGTRTAHDLTVREMRGGLARWPRLWEQTEIVALKVGASTRLQTTCYPHSRGELTLAGVTVESHYPLLLTRTNVRLLQPLSIPVLPAPWRGQLPHLATLMKQAAQARGSSRQGAAAGVVEYVDSRPFQMGDSVRRLDQRASARRGEPMTRVFRGGADAGRRGWRVLFDQSLQTFLPWQRRPRNRTPLDRRLALLYEIVLRGQGEGLGDVEIWCDGGWRICQQPEELVELVAGCTPATEFQPPLVLPGGEGGFSLLLTGCWDQARAGLVEEWQSAGFGVTVVMVPESSAWVGCLPEQPGYLELQE